MARIDTTQNWISKTLEGTYNTPVTGGTNYEFIPTIAPYWTLPKLEKISDAARVGLNAPTHLCSTYWSHFEMPLEDDVETGVPARLFRRALGGTVTDTVVEAAIAWDHTFPILQPQVGSILPFFSVASKMDVADFLLAGCMVDQFSVSQSGEERAKYNATIVGSGKFTTPHGLTSLPVLSPTPCMDSFRTVVSYVDGGTIDLSALGQIINWSVAHNNNIRRNKRRVGDPIQTQATGAGAHIRTQPRGKYTTEISMLLDFIDTSNWLRSVENKSLTDLKFKIVGPLISGSATNRHEFEIIVPRFAFEMIETGDDELDAATPITVTAFEDPVTRGTITGRVRNGVATLL